MSTTPFDTTTEPARHRGRPTLTARAHLATALLMWIAATLAVAAVLTRHVDDWIAAAVAAMLILGTIALAVLHFRTSARYLNAAITRLLGR